MIRFNYRNALLLLTMLFCGIAVQGQVNYDLELQVEMPDTLIAGDSIVVSGYIKNHGPAPYLGLELGMNFSIEQEMIFEAPIPDFLETLSAITYIAVNDSVLFTKTLHVSPNDFELDVQNIVIVWPTDNEIDLDPANDYWMKEVFVADPHSGISYFDYDGDWEEIIDPEIYTQTAKEGNSLDGEMLLSLYPQPCSEVLYIDGTESGAPYMIIDSQGRMISQGTLTEARNSINTLSLNNGLYFFVYALENKLQFLKVLVQH